MNEKEKIIKLISKDYQNPYPHDVFKWDNHEKLDFDRGRFNKHCFQIVENVRQDIVNLIMENLSTSQTEKEHNSSSKKGCSTCEHISNSTFIYPCSSCKNNNHYVKRSPS
jgi:hypothetical protein